MANRISKRSEENPFPHYVRTAALRRHLQRCCILHGDGHSVHVRFEDGTEGIISRIHLKRGTPPEKKA